MPTLRLMGSPFHVHATDLDEAGFLQELLGLGLVGAVRGRDRPVVEGAALYEGAGDEFAGRALLTGLHADGHLPELGPVDHQVEGLTHPRVIQGALLVFTAMNHQDRRS